MRSQGNGYGISGWAIGVGWTVLVNPIMFGSIGVCAIRQFSSLAAKLTTPPFRSLAPTSSSLVSTSSGFPSSVSSALATCTRAASLTDRSPPDCFYPETGFGRSLESLTHLFDGGAFNSQMEKAYRQANLEDADWPAHIAEKGTTRNLEDAKEPAARDLEHKQ